MLALNASSSASSEAGALSRATLCRRVSVKVMRTYILPTPSNHASRVLCQHVHLPMCLQQFPNPPR